jgi:hypothetical protein
MIYYRTLNKATKWVKQTGWDPFKYEKKRKKYYDLLSSDYYENQTWGALQKCWLGFTIAKNKHEDDKLEIYARRIQKLEKQLGRAVTDFSNWGIIRKNQYQT